jgi:ABC-2 type transport system ATP-binding protein
MLSQTPGGRRPDRPVIEVAGLCKRFGPKTALENIEFVVRRGETLGLLGPNGAGKTTTIHLLLGLTTPTAGTIRIFGLPLEKHRREILARVNFSSAYTLLPANLTVYENLKVFGKLYGIAKPDGQIRRLLEFVGIGHTLNSRTGELSTGQITRLNLAKAFINDPEIVFLDEPTASLDPEIAARVRTTLRRIQDERKVTIIYTSHNMQEIEIMCDRILFLSRGKVAIEGTPAEVKQQAMAGSLEEVFIAIARNGRILDAAPSGG